MEGEEEDVSNCLTCPVCLNGYTHLVQDRMPLVGKCGHTICCTCVQSLGYTLDCPICRHENSFKWKSKNYQCIGHILKSFFQSVCNFCEEGYALAQSSESAIKHYHSLLIESKEEDWEEICSDVTNIEKHVTVEITSKLTSLLPITDSV
uniref:RING-type domain-containing protein n=1 Tax=Heterorhabditis bacteriophora TaxID=37862 RepID=A0A1I7WVN1_HETBA